MGWISKNLSSLLIVGLGIVGIVLLQRGGFLGLGGTHALVGHPAPPFALATLQTDDMMNLDEHVGKDVVVLDFFATWCPPCRMSLPTFHEVAAEFAGENVAFYVVNQGEEADDVAAFWTSEEYDLPVLLDADMSVGTAYDVASIPTTVIIAPNGYVAWYHSGIASKGGLRDAIEEARTMTVPPASEGEEAPLQEARRR